jgi:hypothetical protein
LDEVMSGGLAKGELAVILAPFGVVTNYDDKDR